MKTRLLKAALALTFVVAASLTISPAKAFSGKPGLFCRDCPFPAKIADGRWIMPNGKIRVDIDETSFGRGMNQVDVTLRAADSGAVIARGSVVQPKTRKTVAVDLLDKNGRAIKGFVRFLDTERENIQAKFTCEECTIAPMLD